MKYVAAPNPFLAINLAIFLPHFSAISLAADPVNLAINLFIILLADFLIAVSPNLSLTKFITDFNADFNNFTNLVTISVALPDLAPDSAISTIEYCPPLNIVLPVSSNNSTVPLSAVSNAISVTCCLPNLPPILLNKFPSVFVVLGITFLTFSNPFPATSLTFPNPFCTYGIAFLNTFPVAFIKF